MSHNFEKWVVPLCSSRENIEVRLLNHSIWIPDEDYTKLENLEIFLLSCQIFCVETAQLYSLEAKIGHCSVSEFLI